jgi:hypothetical protein
VLAEAKDLQLSRRAKSLNCFLVFGSEASMRRRPRGQRMLNQLSYGRRKCLFLPRVTFHITITPNPFGKADPP